MTPDEHQRERMLVWRGAFQVSDFGAASASNYADLALAEFDKRFPAPALPVPDQSAMGMAVAGTILAQTAELTTLRDKARLWDAVADGAINLSYYESAGFQASWPAPAANGGTARCGSGSKHTAAEAVEAAIAAGALK